MARISHACATVLALILAAPAAAQVSPPGNPPSGPAFDASKPPPKSPAADEDSAKGNGPFAKIGNDLADDGIKFRSLITNELAANSTGGASQGHTDVGQFYIGTDLDLHKLVGWNGAKFHFTLYHDFGNGLSKDVTGTFFKQQDIYKNEFTRWHFGLFSLEQNLFHNKLNIIVGRLGTTAFYGHLQPNCYFQQGVTCGIPVVLNSEAGFGLLPSATWGANVKYKLARKLYFETGAFEVNPTIAATNGLDWSTAGATGYTLPFELGYENANFRTVRYPSEWKIGGYLGTGTRIDPFFNAKGQSAGLTGTAQRNATGLRDGVYIIGDKTFWRPDPATLQSLTIFGGYIQPLEDEEIVDRQIFGGLLLRGLIKSRDHDSVGLSATYLHVSDKELAYLRDNRIRLGGGGTENPNELAFELNYGVAVGSSIRLTPNVQYVVNPESSSIPKIKFVPKNIVTFGLKLTINIATLAGMPPEAASD